MYVSPRPRSRTVDRPPPPFTPVSCHHTVESAGAALRLASYRAHPVLQAGVDQFYVGLRPYSGFYQNFVLIATFLGMGVGLLRASSAPRLKWLLPPPR
jgi:hypothetical protein